MFLIRSIGIALASMLLAASSGTALMGQAGEAGQEKTEKTLKKVPIGYSKPDSGVHMWKDYCAACHGMSGTGDGPAAEFLKSPPADLSLMAKRNNGKFPVEHFASVLKFGSGGHAHGTTDMPVWGPLFRSQGTDLVELRIHNLTEFVESFQQK
jgi:mono/diheme cytochrome c family protein